MFFMRQYTKGFSVSANDFQNLLIYLSLGQKLQYRIWKSS